MYCQLKSLTVTLIANFNDNSRKGVRLHLIEEINSEHMVLSKRT